MQVLVSCYSTDWSHAVQLASLTWHHRCLGALSMYGNVWPGCWDLIPAAWNTIKPPANKYFTLKTSNLSLVGKGAQGEVS